MPIYAVKNTETGQLRLVEAKRPISAINHVVGTMFTVAEADARDGVELGRQGGTVEIAGQSAEDIEEDRQRYQESVTKLVGEGPGLLAAIATNQPVTPDVESDEAE
ncbi:MAG: hypothetical protein A2792_03600 [Sphingomonadales bacterium RIFCSPHIGHO2_01_FULL_65_20]|nr:MAG: hypothetical protein A2792_03600 [Sphingomonadales bacterium RIFCSPHIGHO2_01_FULL_65_20]